MTTPMTVSQQMLVDLLQMDDSSFKNAIFGVHDQPDPKDDKPGLNDKLKPITKGNTPWDGAIWPYGTSSPSVSGTCLDGMFADPEVQIFYAQSDELWHTSTPTKVTASTLS
jgi:hypothetical protein